MKTNYLSLLLLVLAFGCAHPALISPEEEEAHAQTTGAATLTVNEAIQTEGLQVKLLQVQESRCPKEAVCFRYGSAIATLLLRNAAGQTITQQLYLGDPLLSPDNRGFRDADTVVTTLGTKHYRLILRDIQPYPSFSTPLGTEKKAIVAVQAL